MMDALVKAAIGEMGGKHPENPPTEQVATNIAQTETPHHPGAKPVHPRDKAKPV
jgi:hypothetical protein